MGISRRKFLKEVSVIGVGIAAKTNLIAQLSAPNQPNQISQLNQPDKPNKPDQLNKPINSIIYRSVNGSPAENIIKVIESMGGIERLIGFEDVVVIKPNAQWWNQGAPNLSALNQLINLILNQPSFQGEVILAENCHRGSHPGTSLNSGWVHDFEWNADIQGIRNLNALGSDLQKKYGDRFSVCHWIDVGSGGKKVSGPKDGTGYVYCDGTGGVPLISCDNGLEGKDRRETIMTYPIFKTDKGTIVDFKNGIWEKGAYTRQPIRFINLAALNHHSTYCGMTSAIKNYMGITDLSGGPDPFHDGKLIGNYYNFHSFPFNKWAPGPEPGMLGKEIGTFMKTIRQADLNIITAEWVGLALRTEPPVAHTRAILASTDPAALDYHAAKYLLFPNSKISIHNPADKKGPLNAYLSACANSGGSAGNEANAQVISYDCKTGRFQKEDDDWKIPGKIIWGTNPKAMLKYWMLRVISLVS